jgi:hypothetical protein
LEAKKEELQTQKSDLERLTMCTLQNYKITKENLTWYSDIKEELEKNMEYQ